MAGNQSAFRRRASLGRISAWGNDLPRRHAFTLIECLVAVLVVVLLISILLPALSAARRSAKDADTRNQLSAIAAACNGYQALFGSFPGPITEPNLSADIGFSGAQNLVLGLLGSNAGAIAKWDMSQPWRYERSPQVGYDNRALGLTPLPPNAAGQYDSYGLLEPRHIMARDSFGEKPGHPPLYNVRAGELRKVEGLRPASNAFYAGQASPYAPSPLSMLMDRYSDSLPILYFRRDVTMTYPVVGEITGAGAYARRANQHILDATTLQSPSGVVLSQATSGYATGNTTVGVAPGFSTHLEQTLTDSTNDTGNNNSRKARGEFVLISAGQDRIYGPVIRDNAKHKESDDLVVFGGN